MIRKSHRLFTSSCTLLILVAALAGYAQTDANGASTSGILNANSFPGSDIGEKVNAAFSACSLSCTVRIPAGKYSFNTTIKMTSTGQSLIGDGSNATIMTYTGSGDGVFWQMIPFTVEKAGTLKGISLQCTSAATNCVHSGTLEGSTWEDLVISGATGPNANNVLLENAAQTTPPSGCVRKPGETMGGCFTERTYMHNVWLGGPRTGGTTNLHFAVNGGTGSFGYSDIQIWQNVKAGQTGVLVDSGVYLYNSDLEIKGNIDSTNSSTSFFTMHYGQITQSRVNIFGESVAGDHSKALYINGDLQGMGEIQIYAPDAPASNAHMILPVVPNPAGGEGVYLEPYTAFDYPLGTSIAKGYQYIDQDGTVAAALGQGDLSGRLILSWPNRAGRYHQVILDVACERNDTTSCVMNIPVNYAYGNQPVISNPRIVDYISPGGRGQGCGQAQVPRCAQILVTIGNRNGVAQNLIATWFGSTDEFVFLLPGGNTPIGTTPVTTVSNPTTQAADFSTTESSNTHLYEARAETQDVFEGNVTTDARGLAVIALPDNVEQSNTTFRYQLTAIGQFAQTIVAKEVKDHQFTIKTSKPKIKVSWQLTQIHNVPHNNATQVVAKKSEP
jgi:hypothetical protein